MNLKFNEGQDPLIKLRTLMALTSDYKPFNQRTFRFENHIYMILSKVDSAHTRLVEIDEAAFGVESDDGFVTCVNLKAHTLRGINLDSMVEIVEVEANVTPLRWPGNHTAARVKEDF